MVFKKYDEQQTYQVPVSGSIDLKVGDLFAYDIEAKTVTKVTNKDAAVTAIAAGQELYLVAQSDAITHKTGVEYKTYKISDEVKTSPVVAYRVTNIENVEGLEG
jgi:hypothetical protein